MAVGLNQTGEKFEISSMWAIKPLEELQWRH